MNLAFDAELHFISRSVISIWCSSHGSTLLLQRPQPVAVNPDVLLAFLVGDDAQFLASRVHPAQQLFGDFAVERQLVHAVAADAGGARP